jgi:hypothetical protein
MTDYNMYILAIDGSAVNAAPSLGVLSSINVYSYYEDKVISENTDFIVPTITVDGRITSLRIGKASDIDKLRHEVSLSLTRYIEQLYSNNTTNISTGNFAVVGTTFHLPDEPKIHSAIFRTLSFSKPLPELEQIYSSLKSYCEVGGTAREQAVRLQIESNYTTDLQKKWINDFITGWKQKLNWTELIDVEIREMRNRSSKDKVKEPAVIAYRTVPSDIEFIEHSLSDPPGSFGHFREGTPFYPTQSTARSLRKGSHTGETVTYDTKTKLPYPVLWLVTEGAKKAKLGAPPLTANIKEKDLQRALKEPQKWEMLCPKCKERVQIKALLDTGKWNAVDFTELFCPHDGQVQMILKRI